MMMMGFLCLLKPLVHFDGSTEVAKALYLHANNWMHDLQLTNVDFELDTNKVVD